MKVIWKRPDGFHNASPENYKVVQLASGANIWLHRENTEWYPFRVSGDWAKEEGTIKLNRLINLLPNKDANWADHLIEIYFDAPTGDPEQFITDFIKWLDKVKNHLKGDTWELDIMEQVVSLIYDNVRSCSKDFMKKAEK